MDPVKLTRKPNRSKFTGPGDYCIVSDGKVVLCCPYCGEVSWCPHEVVSQEPLTLRPSVVEDHPCKHHFTVTDGWAR